MKVNSDHSKKRKKIHRDPKEDNDNNSNEAPVTSKLDLGRAMNLIKDHYELFEDIQEFQRKKLKTAKESLLESLHQPDDDLFQLDVVEDEPSSTVPQKNVHKRIENLTAEQDERVKQIYKERNKKMQGIPLISLKDAGCEASLDVNEKSRYPLVFPDIEEILTHVQYNRHLTRWIQIKRGTKLKNSIIVSVEGPGFEEYKSQLDDCPSLRSFKVGVEFVSPFSYGDSVEQAFASKLDVKPPEKLSIKEGFQSMKSRSKKGGFVTGLDTLFNIKWGKDDTNKQIKAEENDGQSDTPDKSNLDGNDNVEKQYDLPVGGSKENYEYCMKTKQVLPVSLYKQDNFSRLDLVMTPREMANEKYPLPFIPRYREFVMTKDEYKELTERSPMFGVDCEMCETSAGSELTRISIVNELHEVVYEKLVKPYNKVVNYLTKFSGITAKMLKHVKTRLSDVQSDVRTLLPPDAILVGQSLNCDLIAMKMMHPYVIDTSLIYNLSGERHYKVKLKTLCAEFLSETIQDSKGHDSIEDAGAALKLVQAKLSHYLEWGDAVLGYKRTEEESRKANLELREKQKQGGFKEKFRLAFNAIVDDASRFQGPLHQSLPSQQMESLDKKGNSLKRKIEECEDEETLNLGYDSWTKKRRLVYERASAVKEVPKVDPSINYIYSEVAIVGSEEVRRNYEANLSESVQERITFFEANNMKEVIGKVLELDSQDDTRRLIIAHMKSPCVCQVEKWSVKLKSETKENDLVCISLCGSPGSSSVRGAFFATLPYVDGLPPVKQLVQDYLDTCRHTKDENTSQDSLSP